MYISRGTQYISWVYVVGNIVYVVDSKRIYIVCISRGEQSIYRVGNIVYVASQRSNPQIRTSERPYLVKFPQIRTSDTFTKY